MDRRKSPARAGFTLIEVLVAVLIIATLVAILLPAVRGAFRRAQEAQVTAELNNLATALASFKNTYGDFPPSRILICERGYNFSGALTNTNPATPLADSNCSDITVATLAQRSLLYLRRFWPRVDFLSDPGAGASPGHFHDFNGNGVVDSAGSNGMPYVILSGSECLAFFLGGIPVAVPNEPSFYGVSGFSKSPTFPFVDPVTATNRTVANYDFNSSRMIDLDGDLFPSYLDPLNTNPGSRRSYAYFSSYGTNSYDPNDVNGYDHNTSHATDYEIDPNDPNGTTACEWGFTVSFPVGTSNVAVSPSPNPYTTGASGGSSNSWVNPNSFQIISSGADGIFGYGGAFLSGSTAAAGPLPVLSSGEINTYAGLGVTVNRIFENDNLTNFSSGRLD